MSDLCRLIWCALIGLFRSRAALEAEILVLRHQLNVLRRKSPKRLAFGNVDRLVFAGLYRAAPGILDALKRVSGLRPYYSQRMMRQIILRRQPWMALCRNWPYSVVGPHSSQRSQF